MWSYRQRNTAKPIASERTNVHSKTIDRSCDPTDACHASHSDDRPDTPARSNDYRNRPSSTGNWATRTSHHRYRAANNSSQAATSASSNWHVSCPNGHPATNAVFHGYWLADCDDQAESAADVRGLRPSTRNDHCATRCATQFHRNERGPKPGAQCDSAACPTTNSDGGPIQTAPRNAIFGPLSTATVCAQPDTAG